ncbi:MAG: DNA repair protein RecN [Actinobacteria bacterium]|nr:DNA repair protein RecN [Actinomycetota bacterium]MCG2801550.1 DNA repair protein RecN [Cellulomonas sp.]
MISELRIADLGVIAGAQVQLHPGLTVLTGETGAGKTMVLTALRLLLGGRADAALVRPDATAASVEGRVELPAGAPALAVALEAGAELDDDGSLLLVRTVTAGTEAGPGRSRAYLGGRSVPQAVLAELAASIVTVHGQADQARLRSPARQRDALDAFCGPAHAELLAEHRELWTVRSQAAAELAELVTRATERAREAELLRLGLAEVERVAPTPREDAALVEQVERLSHAEDLRSAAALAHDALAGDDETRPGAGLAVDGAVRALQHAAVHDTTLGPLATRVAEIGYLIADAAAELAGYLDDVQADPQGLERAQQRRAELATLTRSYGSDVDQVLAWAAQAGLRLAELDGGQDKIEALSMRLADLDRTVAQTQSRISEARRAGAERLADAVSAELAGLAMAGAHLEIAVRAAEPSAHGADEVEMLLVAHPGAPALPLARSASGGELSRVMLALEVALAGTTAAGTTFVFDEVDAGVGGRAALEVGRRLAALATTAQVLVVTHLAQVAAFADRHLVVTKSTSGGAEVVTASGVQVVDGPRRVAELARMLSGQETSATALAHAAELLELADVGR